MKVINKRNACLVLSIIIIILGLTAVSCNDISVPYTEERFSRAIFVGHAVSIAPNNYNRVRLQYEYHIYDSQISGVLKALAAWRFIVSVLVELKVLIIDKRKRILILISRYFNGSKYQNILCF